MIVYSKLLPHTCYELGHTWTPSCWKGSFDMFLSAGLASLKIYAFVYLLSVLVSKKKITKSFAVKLVQNYFRSVVFLAINGGTFVGFFCLLRHLFGHLNVLSVSWLPAFFASLSAIAVERESRRGLLALYVSNVASESLWTSLKKRGWVSGVRGGEILLFAAASSVFGRSFKSGSQENSFVHSALRIILGSAEAGCKSQIQKENVPESSRENCSGWRFWRRRHSSCPHKGSCMVSAAEAAFVGALKGYLLHLGIAVSTQLPRLVRSPSRLLRILGDNSPVQTAKFFAWFCSVFKIVCCCGRWWSGGDAPSHGAVAGAAAALGMRFQPSKSLAIYASWKSLEVLWNSGVERGLVPVVPFGVEFLYAFSTAYLFHLAVLDRESLKPSYWKFLITLSNGKIAEFNRYLLGSYGVDPSGYVWPKYQEDFLSETFIRKYIRPDSI